MSLRCAECGQDDVHDGRCSGATCVCAGDAFHAFGYGHFRHCDHWRPGHTLRTMSPQQVIEALNPGEKP